MDATITETNVPANSKPNFEVSDGANFVPVNGITEVRQSSEQYCIIGAGKTGADAVLHLLAHGVSPDKIIWIIPNDVWFLNRKYFTFDQDWVPNIVRQFKSITSDENKTWQDALLRS